MNARTLPTIGAAAVAAGCAGPGGPSPADAFTYAVPSPPDAVYQVADTMSIDMSSPAGDMEVTGTGSVTMALAFLADPGGMRVTGTVQSFSGTFTNPMMGTQTAGLDDVGGNLEVVVGRHGVEELVSFPELAGPVAPMSSFPALGYLLFPRVPGGDVDPGATWVDTVNSSTGTASMSMWSTTNAVNTYTLVGDTVVGGRGLVHIAVAAEVETETTIREGGVNPMVQKMAGSSDGFVLWDPELRLVAYAEYERNLAGTMSMGGMGSMALTVTGPTRIRLEG